MPQPSHDHYRGPRMTTTMSIRRSARAPADRVWQLMAQPACWPSWAPHMAHVSDPAGGAADELREGQRLQIHSLLPRVGVEARVTEVHPPVSWTMRARLPVLGVVESSHVLSIHDAPDVTLTVMLRAHGPAVVMRPLLTAYRPIATFAVHRLLHLATAEDAGARASRLRMCNTDPVEG